MDFESTQMMKILMCLYMTGRLHVSGEISFIYCKKEAYHNVCFSSIVQP